MAVGRDGSRVGHRHLRCGGVVRRRSRPPRRKRGDPASPGILGVDTMTLTVEGDVANWWAVPATTLDYPRIADFLATTTGLDGRTFGSESRDVEEHFDGVLEGGANVVLDDTGEVRGYSLPRLPHGDEIAAEFVFDPAAPT